MAQRGSVAPVVAGSLGPIGGRARSRRTVIRLFVGGTIGIAAASVGGAVRAQDGTPTGNGTPGTGTPPSGTPPATPSGAGGSLTVYSGRSENLVGPLLSEFALDREIRTDVRYAGTAELAATLLEEGEKSPASLFFVQDAGALGLVAQEGLFAPLPQDLLDRVPERFRSPDGLWVGTSGRARVLVYNTEALAASDLPTSVLDLTDPTWAGRVGWAPENASFQAFVTALRLLEGDEAARAWLEGMIANGTVGFGDSNSAIVKAVGNGEIDAGLVNHYYVYAVKKDEGEDFPVANHFFAPNDPGSLVNVAGVGVLAAAPDPEQALALVEFLLGEKAQTYFAESTAEYPLVPGVPVAEGLKPLDEVGGPAIDLSDLADLRGTLELLAEVGLL